jgi:hypothetical protein
LEDIVTTSDQIAELAAAFALAQAHIEGAKKGNVNPAFRSKYADLASVWDACRKALTDEGLSIMQTPRGRLLDAGGWVVEVETRLMHKSGQWIADTITVPVGKPDAQGLGSAITYARRYALSAFVGVAPEDDDGNAASSAPAVLKEPKGFQQWQDDLAATADNGTAALQEAWKKSDPDLKEYMTTHHLKAWNDIKKKADAAAKKLVTA